MKKTFARIALCFAVVCQTVFLVSCSDHTDDEKYQSLPPFFSDMTFRSLHGHSTLSAGDSVVVTAVQSRLGRLLYYATYSWGTAYDTDSVTHAYRSGVVYDNDPADPVDTIVFHRSGTYTVTLALDDDAGNIMTLKVMALREDMGKLLQNRLSRHG